ncbi:nucleotide pyrophosphohydrolase [Petroclostridium sp. X23]|uniref:nucleotide pyrophosphohydrolase n=1 Tax=Petroclostridium sp. X23 TaxID=3045146 RepID=UPI0024ADDF2D|nr:nucleotide pyrophosphohydrolase [Petroclostridium sp. X23]WHH60659.1 nucleotide pyrophosphohydrolase [Petroclostridium sp. X23]
MEDIIRRIIQFRNDRDWKKFHSPENLAKSISIEAAELLENFQWSNEYCLENVADELADVIIYSILMADALNIDFIDAMSKKLEKNNEKYPIDKAKGNSKKYTEF